MDVDIDLADRTLLLHRLDHVAATINHNGVESKHATGVYVNNMPVNPLTGRASLDYETAERLGYIKLDILNVSVYENVRNEEHLDKLVNTEPNWENLKLKEYVEQVVHIHSHWHRLNYCDKTGNPVNSLPRMAMFLACLRPAKKHLLGKPWAEVAESVWLKPTDDSYAFKRSHAVAYAHLVKVNMNLIDGI